MSTGQKVDLREWTPFRPPGHGTIIRHMQTSAPHNQEHSLVIVGVGLIGGSIAAAVRHRNPNCHVRGIGRDQNRLQAAADQGLLTDFADRISADTIPDGSLAVVCLPVDKIADAIRALRHAGCSLVTDAGSVKAKIYQQLGSDLDDGFVGSHPIAGSEHSGFEHADRNLFAGRMCIVTTNSPEEAASENVQRVISFWRSLSACVYLMSPEEHDRVLALTSHLPHILASVAAGCVAPEFLPFAGTGYRDTTRIAAGSASLWASILLSNAEYCMEGIDTATHLLGQFRMALQTGDSEMLVSLWESAAQHRRQLSHTPNNTST